nr:exocyst complex component EXO84C [Ipomoea batatas]
MVVVKVASAGLECRTGGLGGAGGLVTVAFAEVWACVDDALLQTYVADGDLDQHRSSTGDLDQRPDCSATYRLPSARNFVFKTKHERSGIHRASNGIRKISFELLELKDAMENMCGNSRTKCLAFLRYSKIRLAEVD